MDALSGSRSLIEPGFALAHREPEPSSLMQPIVFGPHRGWLHEPVSPRFAGAVVLCAPVGRDERCVHRSMWLLAEQIAARGIPVLRYDHVGSGESLDLPPGADGWARWLEGVREAATCVRARTDAQALLLAGVRIGASLAAEAAVGTGADAIAMLAPVVNGRAWIRELRLGASMLGPRDLDRLGVAGGAEGDGLALSPATVAGIQGLDLRRLGATAPAVFLAARSDDSALAVHLRSLGAQVTCGTFDEYEALFRDAHANEAPQALFASLVHWIERLAAGWPKPAIARRTRASPILSAPEGEECAVTFGAGLWGVLTTPSFPRQPLAAVVLANTGGDPRAGIGGFAVAASRALAARGVSSLRFDFAGLGDSASVQGWRSHAFHTPRLEDFAAAVSLLREKGVSHIIAGGVCSCAYHAIRAAVADPRVEAVFAINPSHLTLRPDPPHNDREVRGWGGPFLRDFLSRAFSPGPWRRLLRGEIHAGAALTDLWRSFIGRWSARLDQTQTRALHADMKALSARGVCVRVIVGSADRALDELETHFGRDGRWLNRWPGLSAAIKPNMDHGLFFSDSRALALEDLVAFVDQVTLGRLSPRPTPSGAPVQADRRTGVQLAYPPST